MKGNPVVNNTEGTKRLSELTEQELRQLIREEIAVWWERHRPTPPSPIYVGRTRRLDTLSDNN